MKLVMWWEEEFLAAFRKSSGFMQQSDGRLEGDLETSGGCGGIVKASDPNKFVSLITKSSDQLLGKVQFNKIFQLYFIEM